MKKVLAICISVILLAGILPELGYAASAATPAADTLRIGDYVILGTYRDTPIVWRYAAEDEHGKMMVSDKILCFKFLGENNFWEQSFTRMWLNSDVSKEEADWSAYDTIITQTIGKEMDIHEKGFLHESNFSQRERSVMKTVTQWTMLPEDHLDLATNGLDTPYNPRKKYKPGSPRDGGYMVLYEIAEFPEAYHGAAYEITDTVFLMDEMQVYRMWQNLGNIAAMYKFNDRPIHYYDSNYDSYFLRTPWDDKQTCMQIGYDGKYYGCSSYFEDGIRPAFYLDEDNAFILSGSGTADDPYIMDGKSRDVTVSCNGTEVSFAVQPVTENDRTLVPFGPLFEAMGARSEWNQDTRTVSASLNGILIHLTADNTTAYVNGEEAYTDVPARIIDGEPFVPLRFAAESLGFGVQWDEYEQLVEIGK